MIFFIKEDLKNIWTKWKEQNKQKKKKKKDKKKYS